LRSGSHSKDANMPSHSGTSRLPNFGSKMGIDATSKWAAEGFTCPVVDAHHAAIAVLRASMADAAICHPPRS
jgi:3-polyprenyl-4-hydroxybenzoate decarboxylase